MVVSSIIVPSEVSAMDRRLFTWVEVEVDGRAVVGHRYIELGEDTSLLALLVINGLATHSQELSIRIAYSSRITSRRLSGETIFSHSL